MGATSARRSWDKGQQAEAKLRCQQPFCLPKEATHLHTIAWGSDIRTSAVTLANQQAPLLPDSIFVFAQMDLDP